MRTVSIHVLTCFSAGQMGLLLPLSFASKALLGLLVCLPQTASECSLAGWFFFRFDYPFENSKWHKWRFCFVYFTRHPSPGWLSERHLALWKVLVCYVLNNILISQVIKLVTSFEKKSGPFTQSLFKVSWVWARAYLQPCHFKFEEKMSGIFVWCKSERY